MVGRLAYWGPHDYDEEQLVRRIIEEPPGIRAWDVETVTTKDRRLIGIGCALNPQEAVYFQVLPDRTPFLALAWRLLETSTTNVWHNGIFDLTVLLEYLNGMAGNRSDDGIDMPILRPHGGRHGVPKLLAGVRPHMADTSLMGQMQGLPGLELAGMVQRYLDLEMLRISDILPERMTMLDIPVRDVAWKCMHDCMGTLKLFYRMEGPKWAGNEGFNWEHSHSWNLGARLNEPYVHSVTEQMLDCYHVSLRIIDILLHMTARGKALRQDRVESWYQDLSRRRLTYLDICDKEGFNPGSPQQVGFVLGLRGNFLPMNREHTAIVTSKEILEELNDPMAQVVLAYRRLSKLLGTYMIPYRGAERAYTHFRQDLSTSRFSSYDRNEQNVPPAIREIYAPDTGVWSWMDDSQIELRIAAEISQDPVMLAAYANGTDVHSLTQSALWPNTDLEDADYRLRSKTFNFAMLYRALAKTLAKQTKLPLNVCEPYREQWLATYPGIDHWQVRAIEDGWNNGYAESMYGRRMALPDHHDMGGSVEHTEKCAVNYPIQGTGFDIIARQMLMCWDMGMDIALQVHDELLVDGKVEFPPELADMGKLYTPFKTHSSPIWI